MNSLILVILSMVGYLLAYKYYGRFIARRILKITGLQKMPAHELEDGVDYVPTRAHIVFGHHFTTIAGLGPIVGPAIGIIWGWLPAFLWVFLGSIFMGAVHDLSTLVVSARNRGKSIGQMTGEIISPSTRYALQFIMQLLLFIVLAVFAMIVASLFVMYPESVIPVWFQIPVALWLGWQIRRGKNDLVYSILALLMLYGMVLLGVLLPVSLPWDRQTSVVAWCILIFIYVYFASTLPVQKLLQPRDYINSHQLLVAMILLVLGVVVAHPVITAPAINRAAFDPGSDVPDLAPLLFIVIACGAISGFHSLASSGTTVKQLNREEDALPVGYGSMITESFLA
ncbi:MAG TPA: carbon starvation protein A, partial [Bacteroides sp.]|nr:carbon starvation protein A [Bacteroides sp.]